MSSVCQPLNDRVESEAEEAEVAGVEVAEEEEEEVVGAESVREAVRQRAEPRPTTTFTRPRAFILRPDFGFRLRT